MKGIIIYKSTLDNYLEENNDNQDDLQFIAQLDRTQEDFIEVDIEKISKNLLEYILINDTNIDLQTKAEITLKQLTKNNSKEGDSGKSIWDTNIKNLNDIMSVYEILKKEKHNADYLILGRKNPAKFVVELVNPSKYQARCIIFRLCFTIYRETYEVRYVVYPENILSLRKEIKNLSFRELMRVFNIYEQKEDLKLFSKRLLEADKLQKQDGKQIICKSLGLSIQSGGINTTSFNQQSSCIVESELEMTEKSRYTDDFFKNHIKLPYVRVFSLLHKKYMYIHIDDILEYKYDKQAFTKLFLPADTKSILEKVFSYSTQNLTGDIINNKHGGLIIMAEGNPGTGKTSTAEVYSELNKKPLYTIQIDEIGTSPKDIENSLFNIFKRVEKWGAIILFDEVDVFLSKRDDNIEKSAIVGIFLRLMDYFRGMMFLTTNRSEVIDNAVLSRITLNIKYPDLTDDVRRQVWSSKLKDAELQINSMEKLIQLDLNGRQIRSMVRLGKMVFGKKANEKEFIDLIKKSIIIQK